MIAHFLLNKMYWSRMQLSATLLPVSGFIGLRQGRGHQWVDNDSLVVASQLSPQIPILPKGGCIMVIKATLPGAGHLRLFPRSLVGKSLNNFFFFNFNALRHMGSQFLGQGLNQHPLYQKHRVLTTGWPRDVLTIIFVLFKILKNNFISNLLMKQKCKQTRSLKKALADKTYCSQYRQACIFKKECKDF